MATFPKLRTGAVAQYPSSNSLEYLTCVLPFVDGTEQRFREYKQAVSRWIVRLTDVDEEEMFAVEEFFIAHRGQIDSFSFIDPFDGTEYPDCSFDSDSMEFNVLDEGRCSATLVIRNNQV